MNPNDYILVAVKKSDAHKLTILDFMTLGHDIGGLSDMGIVQTLCNSKDRDSKTEYYVDVVEVKS